MKIIKLKEDLPTPCKTCRKLRQAVRIPVYHCALRLHFPTVKNTCKREDMKAVELFKKFLRDNGIYEKYCRNFDVKYNNGTKIKNIKDFIYNAFLWGNTSDGYEYWLFMDERWQSFVFENSK